jgi:hypothetical protein
MNKNDEIEFASLMAGMSEAFGLNNSKTKIDIYFEQLKDFSIEQVKRAVAIALRTLKFFPKIAELRELIEGSSDDKATIAWEFLFDKVDEVDYYHSPQFKDWRIMWCVEQMGGWMHLCSINWGELKFRQKEFERLYKIALLRPDLGDETPEHLVGFFEQDNHARGFLDYIPEPTLIGDQFKKQIEYRKKINSWELN